MAQFTATVTYDGATMTSAIVQVTKVESVLMGVGGSALKFGWLGTVSVYPDATAQVEDLPTKTFDIPQAIPQTSDSDAPFELILAVVQKMPMFSNIANVIQ